MYLNKAMIIGNLTRDPEMRALPSGIQVTSFSLATNRVWKGKDGGKQESTDYHNIVMFGRLAEIAQQYLKKGATAYVEGRIQTRSWEQDGVKKYRTEIVADKMQMGPKGSSGGSSYKPAEDKQEAPSAGDIETIEYPDDEANPEDIPF